MNTIEGWGGGEKWHFENAVKAVTEGYNVYFIVNENSKLLAKLQAYPKIKIFDISFSKRSYLNPFVMLKLYHFLKKEEILVLLFNSIRDMNTASFPAHQAKVNKIVLRYGWDHTVKRKIHTKLAFNYFVTDVFANSNWVKRRLLESRLLKESQVDILHNGVKSNKDYIKNSMPILSEDLVLGFAGRLTFEKGIAPLLAVMEVLKTKKVKLLIAGTGPDEKQINEMIVSKGLTDSIKMLGFLDNMEEFYSKIDILIHLTYAEGISNTVIEAMISKKPIIAFNVASMPEIISDGVTGFLVELHNVDAVVDKINKFLLNRELIKQFSEQAFLEATEKFNFDENFTLLKNRYLV